APELSARTETVHSSAKRRRSRRRHLLDWAARASIAPSREQTTPCGPTGPHSPPNIVTTPTPPQFLWGGTLISPDDGRVTHRRCGVDHGSPRHLCFLMWPSGNNVAKQRSRTAVISAPPRRQQEEIVPFDSLRPTGSQCLDRTFRNCNRT